MRLALAVSLAAGFAAALAAENASSVQCSLDLVSERLVPGGFVTLIGWAAEPASATPVPKMDVWLDGAVRGDVLLWGYRPDVAAHFGQPGYRSSGWTATLSLAEVEPGPHRVEVVARSRAGDLVSCAARDVNVRPFSRPAEPPPWRAELVLFGRIAALVGWLAFVGWGPTRLVSGRAVRLAPSVGLALFAVVAEAGGVVNVRPLGSALALMAVSAVLLVVSARRRAVRLRKPGRVEATVFAIAVVFAVVGSLPLMRHGSGAVLGQIADAAWESSVGESIARYGWRIPADVHGHLAAVPMVWRAADFRAGVPYPLAFLAQAFSIRAHEAHGVLTVAAGALVIWTTGVLAGALRRRVRWIPVLAAGLAAANSVLLAQLYHQHTGVLIAALLYLSFVYALVTLLPLSPAASIVPIGALIAGAWTLYPETMVLWVLTAASSLVLLCRTWRSVARRVVRLGLAALLAAAINPVGLARSVRFTNSLRHASALATPELRMSFGDTHYFPSPAVIAGVRPYRIDSPALAEGLAKPLILVAELLVLLAVIVGVARASGRERRLLILLLAPVSIWLLLNRAWQFPYGYSKGLPHLAPLWCLSLGILLAASVRRGRWCRPLALATVIFVGIVSVRGSIEVLDRAIRTVPAYDTAFRSLPDLVRGIDRNALIVVPELLDARREWIGYFLGEYRIVKSREEANSPPETPGQQVFELFDRRGEEPVPRSNLVRSGPFFALVGT